MIWLFSTLIVLDLQLVIINKIELIVKLDHVEQMKKAMEDAVRDLEEGFGVNIV